MAWGPLWKDTGLVFTREDGNWIHPETFSWWFDHVKKSGLPRITLHGLRHTHVTLGKQAELRLMHHSTESATVGP